MLDADYRKFQRSVHERWPVLAIAEIEPTTRCTARCVFCPRDALTRGSGDMTVETATAIAERLAEREPLAVLLSGFGEPTRHPDLAAIVRVVAGKVTHPVGVVTNGENLSRGLAEELIGAGARFFHVTVAAATEDTALRVAPGLDFARATRNLCELIDLCRERATVAVNVTVTDANRAEKAEICRAWRRRGAAAVYAAREHNRGGHLSRPRHRRSRADCWVHRSALFITWDGRILACCHDLAGESDFGLIAERPLAEIEREKGRRLAETLAGTLCRSCDFGLADRGACHGSRDRFD